MESVFYPQSVAVVGVSAKPDNLGQNIVLNLVNFGFERKETVSDVGCVS